MEPCGTPQVNMDMLFFYFLGGKRPTVCAHGQYQCTQGDCILLHYVCDGEKDCPNDSSDEDFCGKLLIYYTFLYC